MAERWASPAKWMPDVSIRKLWDRQECPGCRDTGKVWSERIWADEWEHTCDRCNIRWESDKPIDERP